MLYLILILFLATPFLSIIYFLCNLFDFCVTKKQAKKQPDSVDENELKASKRKLIISAIIAAVLVVVVIIFAVLMVESIAYM